jgi:hypothetical protein
MNTGILTAGSRRSLLLVLALEAAYVGLWAAAAPSSFYRSFPGGGRHWVAVDGPYNEHLVRDVGALYLALLVFSVAGVVRADPDVGRLAGAGWLVFSGLHLAYHAAHLADLGRSDQVLNVVALGGTTVLAALLCLPARPTRVVAGSAPTPRVTIAATGGTSCG